jgi:hypothetical protein
MRTKFDKYKKLKEDAIETKKEDLRNELKQNK